ncbi:exported hypothetical protein [Candidatus Sulfopaludibacter sp. SbA4]|nr:exported hypothetical protein [Candidatus Sulfopaludibacter sp. SbA4]
MKLWQRVSLCVAIGSLAWSQQKKTGKKAGDDTSNPAYAHVPVSTAADPSGKPAPPSGFVHPGVLVNRTQLDEIKKRVAAGTEPQKTAFEALKTDKLGALDYTPHPRDTVECGPRSNPDIGCKDEQADSEAAYAQALLWYITGNSAYAQNAMKILNAWSGTLTGGHTNANAEVQASWAGAVWPRAAEIIRYSYKGWTDAEIAKFQNMLTAQYLPSLIHGTCENGNKELTMSEAILNIGVFNDNRAAFDFGIKMWRGRAPATIRHYLPEDRWAEAARSRRMRTRHLGEQRTDSRVRRRPPPGNGPRFPARQHGIRGHGRYRRDRAPAGDRFVRGSGDAHHGRHGIPGAIPAAQQCQGSRESGIQSPPHLGDRLQPFPRSPGKSTAEDGGRDPRQPAHRREPSHGLGDFDPRRDGLDRSPYRAEVTPF